MLLRCRDQILAFPRRPLVMGIVNINDDSFCGDGSLDVSAAVAQATHMLRDGADIIDIGAESARTNRGPISIDEELSRLLPFMAQWPDILSKLDRSWAGPDALARPLLSINTWRTEVVEQVLPEGGDILNDISALPSSRHAGLCAEHGAALLIMHTIGTPKVPHTHIGYTDVIEELQLFFGAKIKMALEAGLSREQLILDPGIDFAKQRSDNLRVYRELDQFRCFERPILVPVSRKTVIGEVLGLPNPVHRDAGTIACVAAAMRRGASLFRVHHVAAAVQASRALWSVMDSH